MRIWVIIIAGALSLAAKTYPVDGIVVAIDPASRTMLVSHRPIPGYMGAMMMPFRVGEANEMASLYPGAHVAFDLVVDKQGSVARHVRKAGGADLEIAPPKEALRVGEPIADFRLTDQLGRVVTLADLRGKWVAVDFIYSRCPLPDVCPRLAANFAALQRRFAGDLGKRLMLVSVTVDPEYDTPAVLADYARRWGADPNGWRFLTGDVAKLAAQLGELYWTDEGSIGHNSTTSVIDPEGKLAARVEGSNYRVDQLANLIERELKEGMR